MRRSRAHSTTACATPRDRLRPRRSRSHERDDDGTDLCEPDEVSALDAHLRALQDGAPPDRRDRICDRLVRELGDPFVPTAPTCCSTSRHAWSTSGPERTGHRVVPIGDRRSAGNCGAGRDPADHRRGASPLRSQLENSARYMSTTRPICAAVAHVDNATASPAGVIDDLNRRLMPRRFGARRHFTADNAHATVGDRLRERAAVVGGPSVGGVREPLAAAYFEVRVPESSSCPRSVHRPATDDVAKQTCAGVVRFDRGAPACRTGTPGAEVIGPLQPRRRSVEEEETRRSFKHPVDPHCALQRTSPGDRPWRST